MKRPSHDGPGSADPLTPGADRREGAERRLEVGRRREAAALVEAVPDDLDAQHALLTIYPQIDYQQEQLALADDVLARLRAHAGVSA